MAEKHGATTAQVTLRWIRDQKIVAIPRSSSAERRRQNAELDHVVLDDEDRTLLASVDLGEDAAWDSREHEEW